MNPTSAVPLVVDLDGTLTPTDTLHESLFQVLRQSPTRLPKLLLSLLKGKAAFKDQVATYADIDPALLPYRQDFLSYLQSEKENGRAIILATAAHSSIAEKVAGHLGLFDQVLATEQGKNLKGAEKLESIRANVGDRFAYAGDSKADLPIWEAATSAILIGVSPETAEKARRHTDVEFEIPRETAGLTVWLRALRVHQWLKNFLLFVPLLTAFSFLDVGKLLPLILAFFSFSIAASGTYVLNDLWDLQSDRTHPRKRTRPFASGRLPLHVGLCVAVCAIAIGFVMSAFVTQGFFLMLLLYLVMTSLYSWVLKTYVLIDVLALSLLYTLRILAGSIAVNIPTSSWLLAFSVFVFLSLALVKRCAELVSLKEAGRPATRGRDYRVTDLDVLWPMGVGAALSAVVVFGLFISVPETQERYASPYLLWLVAVGLVYWLGRLWIKASRGEMDDDPVVYAIKDRGSRVVVFIMLVAMIISHAVDFGEDPVNPLFIALASISMSVAAQFSLKAGMSGAEVKAVLGQPPSIRWLITILANKYVFLGFLLYGLGAIVWLGVLSKWDVSKAYPLVGLGFAFTALIGFLIGEEMTMTRLVGVALICSGVFLVGRA